MFSATRRMDPAAIPRQARNSEPRTTGVNSRITRKKYSLKLTPNRNMNTVITASKYTELEWGMESAYRLKSSVPAVPKVCTRDHHWQKH